MALYNYYSARELVLTLADTVSRGGNLLLNVGATADGRIPVIEEERLNQIGDWLKVNGEAIFGARPWIRTLPIRVTRSNLALLPQQPESVEPLVGKGELVCEGEHPSGARNRVT